MAAILYLDVDDEITTAAARIRGSADPKVVLVVPPGSRIATSRMNFRLLAREALERNRGLSIVAPDAAARAIAGSAGLPVFASVAEFEASIAPPPPPVAPPPVAPPPGGPGPDSASGDRDAGVLPVAGLAAAGLVTGAAEVPPSGPAAAPEAAPADADSAVVTTRRRRGARAAAGTAVVAKAAGEPASSTDASVTEPVSATFVTPPTASGGGGSPADQAAPPVEPRARSSGAALPVVPVTRVRRGVSRWLVVGILALLVVGAIAVAGYLVLPSATVVVTPSPVPVAPGPFVVRADPDATSVDAAGGVVPATRLSKDFSAAAEFKATGKRVVTTKAKGSVSFQSNNTVGSVRVKSGTVVSTLGGVAFVTQATVIVPRATVVGSTISAGHASVAIVAVKAGPAGNVGADEITRGPDSLVVQQVSVTNPNPTTGGSREEFTRVSLQDVATAQASLAKDLQAQFDAWVAAPDELPAGSTTFPATARLTTPVPTTDPATLVNVEEPTFQLGATATGTVVAVDATLLEQVATERVTGSVPAEHRLIPGSVKVSTDKGQADGDLVDFQVTATASAIPLLDAAVLRDAIRGKPIEEAERLLKQYGTVSIETWPSFVSSIPTLDARIQITIAGDAGAGASSPPPTEATPSPTGPGPAPSGPAPSPSAS